MPMFRNELNLTSYRLKDEEDARYEEAKKAVVRLFVKHKQEKLLPMLGLEAPPKPTKGKKSG